MRGAKQRKCLRQRLCRARGVVYAPVFLTLVIAPVLAALVVLFSVSVSVPVPAHVATPKHQKSSAPAFPLTAQPKLG